MNLNLKYRKKGNIVQGLNNIGKDANGCNTTTNKTHVRNNSQTSVTGASCSTPGTNTSNFQFPDGGWVCSQC